MNVGSEGGETKVVTGTGEVYGGRCKLLGFYVNSTTGGTVVITRGSVAASGTITPAIGFHRFPCDCPAGFSVTIANTLNATFFYEPY